MESVEKLDVGLLLVRVVFGATMFLHGWNKIFAPSGITGTANWFASIGMKWPRLQAQTAASAEIISGILMCIGLLTWVSSTIFIALMVVAIVTVHSKVGFFIFLPGGGWEYCFSIAAVATGISLTGPGQYSLDNALDISQKVAPMALPIALIFALCHLLASYRPQRQPSSS